MKDVPGSHLFTAERVGSYRHGRPGRVDVGTSGGANRDAFAEGGAKASEDGPALEASANDGGRVRANE